MSKQYEEEMAVLAYIREKDRYKCFLCEKEIGIFEQTIYGEYCVCHSCVGDTVRKTCADKQKENLKSYNESAIAGG